MLLAPEPATETAITSFPLQRPSSLVKRRGVPAIATSIPYFIAGDENRLVSLVCQGQLPVFELGNPILLTGPSGSGKSVIALHLASQAAIDQSIDGEPAKVMSVSALDFARSYAEAIAADDLKPLSDELATATVLVIDDLHLIADKPAAQEEIALRIESRVDSGKPTILTCKRMPSEVRGIRSRLASRAVPGLTIPIALPKASARKQLLVELAMQIGLDIDPALLSILDAGLDTSLAVRRLESAIKQVSLYCRMHDCEANVAAIQSAIDSTSDQPSISLATITNSVARYFRLKSSDLRSSSRKQNFVRARSLAMFLARQLTSTSMHQIGEYFGGRDHTTVLHAVRKTGELLKTDSTLKQAADELTEKLGR